MSKEIKPCMNDMCYSNIDDIKNYNCNRVLASIKITIHNLEKCAKYITEKPKSAWELRNVLIEMIYNLDEYGLPSEYFDRLNDIDGESEQEAIKIMQGIEKELKA